ncbi:MAG: divalent-cation tolerance protein CutA [Pseudomonadota bacterium]
MKLIYCPINDAEIAERLARHLVKNGLAACVNIHGPVRSVFRWDGQVDIAEEVVMVIKVSDEALATCREALIDQHPYDTPAIIVIDVNQDESHQAFLDWVRDTKRSPDN